MYVTKTQVRSYALFPCGRTIEKVRIYCDYNSLPWGICQLNINHLDTKWGVPIFFQEQLEEHDQTPFLGQFWFSVPGNLLLPASNYLIGSRIRGSWCSTPCIYQDVEVMNNVIKQVLSTSVPPPLPNMEDCVVGYIVEADCQKEDDADPPVALWDSWFYRGWE